MLRRLLGVTPMAFIAGSAFAAMVLPAAAGMGQPSPGQMGLQLPATQVAAEINKLHDFVNIIIVAITIFVMLLMAYVMWRFRESASPTPSKTTHNTAIEVAWTVIPIAILVVIAIPSFKLLNLQYDYPKPDVTIKATAYQWYWSHEYPDHGGFSVDSVMLQDDDRQVMIKKGIAAPRNLAVDNEIVVPVNKVVHMLVTAGDVIHNWTVPSFGSKVDAVPGRVTATWFKVEKEGIFYGQCSELCGKDHAFMPIAVRVVKDNVFNEWAAALKAKDKKKAKEIIEKAALEQSGVSKVAETAAPSVR
ncbi:MAG: cytochrome c oxidase subunit II [Hyphomicrobium sp.]|nr:MAG: cytochrome c oxidase subunit II [Hyphomicrobium sp.]